MQGLEVGMKEGTKEAMVSYTLVLNVVLQLASKHLMVSITISLE